MRQRVVSRLEVWLQNPKWSRPAQELLVSLCSNLTSHTQFDVDVISQLVKFRIKAKPIVNLYLSCMRSVARRVGFVYNCTIVYLVCSYVVACSFHPFADNAQHISDN